MEAKKKRLSCRKYDVDFKAEVLKMVFNGQSVAYVSKALGVSENLIYCWKQKTDRQEKAVLEINPSFMCLELYTEQK